jgi:hypothetical protein
MTNSHCFGAENLTLDWEKRPENIKQEIIQEFTNLSSQNFSSWGKFNGEKHYSLLGINEHLLLKQMIKDAYPQQKEFYVMDIGAGNFEWGRSIAGDINGDESIPNDIVLHIIGIRAEKNTDPEKIQKGKCILYELGKFPIENMANEFHKRNYDFSQKIDIIVSRWTFVHFVDSLGTFIQAYNYLRPKTGVILMDGFRLLFEDTKPGEYRFQDVHDYDPMTSTYNFDSQILYFLSHIKAPVLVRDFGETTAHIQFMIRRPDDKKLEIPVTYIGLLKVAEASPSFKQGATKIVQYHRNVPWITENIIHSYPNHSDLLGDFQLYQWVAGIKVLTGAIDWQPFITSQPPSKEEKEYLESVEKRKKEEEEEGKKKYAKRIEKQAEQKKLNQLNPKNIIEEALYEDDIEKFKQALSNNNNWKKLILKDKYGILNKAIEMYATKPQLFDAIREVGIDHDVINYRTMNGTIMHNIVHEFKFKSLTLEQATMLSKILVSLGADLRITRHSDGGRTPLDNAKDLEDKSLYDYLKKIEK